MSIDSSDQWQVTRFFCSSGSSVFFFPSSPVRVRYEWQLDVTAPDTAMSLKMGSEMIFPGSSGKERAEGENTRRKSAEGGKGEAATFPSGKRSNRYRRHRGQASNEQTPSPRSLSLILSLSNSAYRHRKPLALAGQIASLIFSAIKHYFPPTFTISDDRARESFHRSRTVCPSASFI